MFGIFLILLLGIYLLLLMPAVQTFGINKAARFLSERLQTTVSVSGVSYRLFNHIVLKDVYIADLQQDTLIHVGKLSAGVSIRNLMRNRIVFRELSLNEMSLRLTNDSLSGNNFDFIIDAFSSDNPRGNTFFQFKSVKISDSRVRFEQLDREAKYADLFDANHLDFKNLNLKLRVDKLTNDTLAAIIGNISFDEKSGFSVRGMQANINANTSQLTLKHFKILLPETRLAIDTISLRYGNLQNFKHFNDSVTFKFSIEPSDILLKDLAAFVPKFKNFRYPVELEGSFYGQISDLTCPHLSISYGDNFSLTGKFNFEGLPKVNNTQVSAQITNLQFNNIAVETIVSEIRGTTFALPDNFAEFGMLRFDGNVRGNAAQLLADGRLQTQAGTVNADVNLQFRDEFRSLLFAGNVGTHGFSLGRFLRNKQVGNIAFNLTIDGNRLINNPLSMSVNGNIASVDFNGYNFSNILLDGTLDGSKFNGSAHLRDENGNVDFKGLIDFSREASHYDFFARLKNVAPQKMKLVEGVPDLSLSMLINANGNTNTLGKLNGEAVMDSLTIVNKDNQWRNQQPIKLALQDFSLDERFAYSTEKTVVALESDFLKGKLEGSFTIAGIVADVQNLATQYLPSLVKSARQSQARTNINFDFALFNCNVLSELLEFPLLVADSTYVTGSYDKPNNNVALDFRSPQVNFKKMYLTDVQIDLNNAKQYLELLLAFDSRKNPWETDARFDLSFSVLNDVVNTKFLWKKINAPYQAELLTKTTFSRQKPENKLVTDIEIQPSQVLLNDTVWNIVKSRINITPDKVSVNNFRIEHLGHSLLIDGFSTKGSEEDRINLRLNDLYLRYLNMFVTTGGIALDGKVSGNITLHNLRENFFFTSNIKAKSFSFNNSVWGDVNVLGTWDKENKNIKLAINVENENQPVLQGRGIIFPMKDSIEMNIRSNGLKADFLSPFLDNVVQNFKGEIYTDKLRLFGKTFNPFFDGKMFVKNGSLNVDFLRTSYYFNDTVYIKKDEIRLDNLQIADAEHHKGAVSGYVRHNRWKDFRYNIRINATDNMLVLNTREQDNEMFHGRVYGSGTVRISGDMNSANFDIGFRNGNRSTLVIPLAGYSEITDNSFIHFVPKTPVNLLQTEGFLLERSAFSTPSTVEMNVRLQVDANPGATVQLIVDPNSGDAITATGSGNLTLEYSNRGNLRMLGTYTIEQGTYNFTFRDIIRRTFRLRQGGTIQWSGAPYDAILNIVAYYAVTASLADILGDAMPSGARQTVPVNCIMNITGNMQRPDIAFDIELPVSDEEVRRRVRSVINSEDMMSRQFAMLLTIGRFYAPETTNSASIFDAPGNEFASVASSSISGQLNQWLSQMTDIVNLGVNYRPGVSGSTMGQEFDLVFSTELLDRRLIFNGNVGFRDDLTGRDNNFVGDFDLEYKLNASGTLRARAFSRTNDFYFRQTSLTTQGLGIMFTKRFDTFGSLWNRYFGREK